MSKITSTSASRARFANRKESSKISSFVSTCSSIGGGPSQPERKTLPELSFRGRVFAFGCGGALCRIAYAEMASLPSGRLMPVERLAVGCISATSRLRQMSPDGVQRSIIHMAAAQRPGSRVAADHACST
jgi:hypothetical protein